MEYIKQSMNDIWAAAGDVVMPEAVKIAEGWLVEVPPRQYWNWMQNRTDVNLAYIFQRGVPEWDISVEYLANKSFVVYNGVVYKCILTGVGKNPESQPTYWVRAFRDWSAIGQAVDNLTPAADRFVYYTGANTAALGTVTSFARSILDDTSAAAVRTTIGAQATDATLTAVAGVTTAANKLIYFTGVDTAAATDLSAFGRSLIDDADASAARTTLGLASGATTTVGTIATQNANSVSITGGSITGITDLAITDGGTGASTAAGARSNLGLGTAAVADVTTSSTDTTAGRLLKVGDFGRSSTSLTYVTGTLDSLNYTSTWNVSTVLAGSDNFPFATGGVLTVERGPTANYATQEYSILVGSISRKAIRHNNNGVWQPWRELYHTGNLLNIGTTADSARTALALGTAAVATLTESATDNIVGKVLKVGDFGIGSNAVTLTGVDLNTMVRTGFYIATSPVNGPAGTTTNLLVLGNTSGSGRTMQIAQPVNSETYYVRSQSAGTWSTWKQLYHSGNLLNIGTTAATARTALGLDNVDNTSDATKSIGGNAATATKLQTARTIALSGDVTGSGSFDGSGNVSINAQVADDSHTHSLGNLGLGTAATKNVGTSIGDVVGVEAFGLKYAQKVANFGERIDSGFYLSAGTSDNRPTGMVADGGWMINLNWAFNGAGNRYNCAFYGNVQNNFIGFRRINHLGEPQTPVELYHTGNINTANVATATKLQTPRTINGVSFDGSANITVADATKVPLTSATGAAVIPAGTEAQRPASPVNGQLRYNSGTSQFEGYQGGAWKPIGGGDSSPMFSVMWWPQRSAIPAGYVAADGQTLSRATYPDAWAGIQAGNVPTVADATWNSTPTERGKFTAGDGSTTFRLPDYNGKFSGSLGAVFLRGDGALSAAIAGVIQQDTYKDHSHAVLGGSGAAQVTSTTYGLYGGTDASSGVDPNTTDAAYFLRGNRSAKTLISNASVVTSQSADVSTENRPLNVTGCWVIKLYGAVVNTGSADAAQLASDYANLASRTTALEGGKLDATNKGVCTAWVNFNGTGTVTIRDSYNVSSITDNGTGDYTVNFATPMGNTNYSCVAMNQQVPGLRVMNKQSGTIGGVRVVSSDASVRQDSADVSVIVFGGK